MKTPNLITDSIKAKEIITKKKWDTWVSDLKLELKQAQEENKPINEKKNFSKDKISMASIHIDEIKRAQKALKTSNEKALLSINSQLIIDSFEEIMGLKIQESLNLARIESNMLNWKETEKILDEIIVSSTQQKNGIKSLEVGPEVYLLKAKAAYLLTGQNSTILEDALKLYPKSQAIRHELASNEIRKGKFDRAFDLVKGNLKFENPFQEAINAILLPGNTGKKELAHPSNYYTYQYNLIKPEFINVIENYLTKQRTNTASNGSVSMNPSDDFEDVMRVFYKVFKEWQSALDFLHRKEYTLAINALQKSKQLAIRILRRYHNKRDSHTFSKRLETRTFEFFQSELEYTLEIMFTEQTVNNQSNEFYMLAFKAIRDERKSIIDVETLYQNDWKKPLEKIEGFSVNDDACLIYQSRQPSTLEYYLFHEMYSCFAGGPQSDYQGQILGFPVDFSGPYIERYKKIDYPLVLLASVFTSFATIEAYRFSNQLEKALSEIDQLLALHEKFQLLNPIIEFPFLKILQAQILKEKAEKEFKSGTKEQGVIVRASLPLKALNTYKQVLNVLDELGDYKSAVDASILGFNNKLSPLTTNRILSNIVINEAIRNNRVVPNKIDFADRSELKKLGKRIYLPRIQNHESGSIPLTPQKKYPLQQLVNTGNSSTSFRETNPIVYAIYLETQARIIQINEGFNYLGYKNDFVPPWKFNYLLDRSRYYADQSKNLQRDYLNFLTNAEREEFQEKTSQQTVSMERMNLTIENARADMSISEWETAKESTELAELQTTLARERKANFDEYDHVADIADIVTGIASAASAVTSIAMAVGTGGASEIGRAVSDTTRTTGDIAQLIKGSAQRDMEGKNLTLSITELDKAKAVSEAHLKVAEKALLVSNLQAQSALMRLEFARDNYEFLRNRLTNAEMWFRLAHHVREVSNTYFRRATEMAFLTEQAYEFMVDKKLDIIRFDYDNDELGDMLGADYLKADLDYLENHLIINQKEKQQQVKCVISMARDFPQALQDLRENGRSLVPVSLTYLEKRFPGLYQMKVAAIDVQPFVIANPTRFNVELSYLGSGLIRTQVNSIYENGSGETLQNDFGPYGAPAWISNAETLFPVKTLLSSVETSIYSGLSASEESSYFQSFSAQQKAAFEDCPAAGGWMLDMSMTENEVVPGSMADMVLTFYLTGYYSTELKNEIENAARTEETLVTNTFSAQREFPDALFDFQRSGKIGLPISPEMLTMNKRIGKLNELSLRFIPSKIDVGFTRFSSISVSKFFCTNNFKLEVISETPQVFLEGKNMELNIALSNVKNKEIVIFAQENPSVQLSRNAASNDTHDFGKIEFKKQGKQIVIIRETTGGVLNDYSLEVFVSKNEKMILPTTTFTKTSVDSNKTLAFSMNQLKKKSNGSFETVSYEKKDENAQCLVLDQNGKLLGETTTDKLSGFNVDISGQEKQDLYVIVLYTKKVTSSFQCNQDIKPFSNSTDTAPLRTNVKNHNAQNPLTPFAKHLFGPDLKKVKSPVDHWQLEITPAQNPFLECYDCNGIKKLDATMFSDIILSMEYYLHP